MPFCHRAILDSIKENSCSQSPYPSISCEWRKGVSYESLSPDCVKDEMSDAYVVTFSLPCIEKDDIDVMISEGLISIEGTYKDKVVFSTIREIPCDVEVERVSADFDNGILQVTFPKIKPIHVKVQ
jgi:HSP20 family molecular chaperone IbpA